MYNSRLFGDKNVFAISYQTEFPDFTNEEQSAICHLIIDNNLIGNSDEPCYLPTWTSSIARNRDFIRDNKNNLYFPELDGLTDREAFEIICKSNQLNEEFDEHFSYLPQLDSEVWSRHSFHLDETTDSLLIRYYIKENKLRFIIQKWRENDGTVIKDVFIIKSVDLDFFIKTLDEMLAFLEKTYPYLSNSIN